VTRVTDAVTAIIRDLQVIAATVVVRPRSGRRRFFDVPSSVRRTPTTVDARLGREPAAAARARPTRRRGRLAGVNRQLVVVERPRRDEDAPTQRARVSVDDGLGGIAMDPRDVLQQRRAARVGLLAARTAVTTTTGRFGRRRQLGGGGGDGGTTAMSAQAVGAPELSATRGALERRRPVRGDVAEQVRAARERLAAVVTHVHTAAISRQVAAQLTAAWLHLYSTRAKTTSVHYTVHKM